MIDKLFLDAFTKFIRQAETQGDQDVADAMRRIVDTYYVNPAIKRSVGASLMEKTIEARKGHNYSNERLWIPENIN